MLLEKMSEDGLVLLNGRTNGDFLGNCTFSNYKGYNY